MPDAIEFLVKHGSVVLFRGGKEMRRTIIRQAKWARSIGLLTLMLAVAADGQQLSLVEQTATLIAASRNADGRGPVLAFDRYLASLRERNPFTESGPVGVEIEASLPSLGKQGKMLAVRRMGDSERSEYQVVSIEGDATIKQQVIARYLAAEDQAEALPYASVAVIPANYRFRYIGSVQTNGMVAFGFQITPKKKRPGLIRGEIWIDSASGVAVHQTGRFVKRPSVFIRRVEVARDTNMKDGLPYSRVTHLTIDTRLAGRAELTIVEHPLELDLREATAGLITQGVAR